MDFVNYSNSIDSLRQYIELIEESYDNKLTMKTSTTDRTTAYNWIQEQLDSILDYADTVEDKNLQLKAKCLEIRFKDLKEKIKQAG